MIQPEQKERDRKESKKEGEDGNIEQRK